MANDGLWTKSGPPMFLEKISLVHSPIWLYVYGCFHTTKAEWGSCDRESVIWKLNIFTIKFFKENVCSVLCYNSEISFVHFASACQFYVISQGAVDLYLILQLQNIRLLSFNNTFQGGNLWNVYETEVIPDRNKLWLLTTLASFTVLVTAVLWMLWWDLSRGNLFLGVYLADKLYLLDIRDLTAYKRSPCSLQSMTEITWVLWDSSWDCKFPRISLQFCPALLYLPLPFYKSQICIVFWKFSLPKTASFPLYL